MLRTVVALVAVVALLPAPIFCSSKYAKGILLDGFRRALTVPGGSTSNGVKYTVTDNYDRSNPEYYLNTGEWQQDSVLAANSSFYIKSLFNGKCVTASLGLGSIAQQDCAGLPTQRWRFYKDSKPFGLFQLQNEQTGLCLGYWKGGATSTQQSACTPILYSGSTSWTIAQFAVVDKPGLLKSVATNKCLAKNEAGQYFMQSCNAAASGQWQHLWMWDNTKILNVGQPWNSPRKGRMCTSSSPDDWTKISEAACPNNYMQVDAMKWIHVGNVDDKFQIKNIGGGMCLNAVPPTPGAALRLSSCTGATNLLWVRAHASYYMKGTDEPCQQHSECLSDGCDKDPNAPPYKEGVCVQVASMTGSGCRDQFDCRTQKCRDGKCACLTKHETDSSGGGMLSYCNFDFDCCSGRCEYSPTEGYSVCGCHSYFQPCASNSECCSNSCDPEHGICNCVKTGVVPLFVEDWGGAGHAFTTLDQLCCSGHKNSSNVCDTGGLGTYCDENFECDSGHCHENHCSCPSYPGSCVPGADGNAYCKSCFGVGSYCFHGQCCYAGGLGVFCEGETASDGSASNAACCSGRCWPSGTRCASGREDAYCSAGGPSCSHSENELIAQCEEDPDASC